MGVKFASKLQVKSNSSFCFRKCWYCKQLYSYGDSVHHYYRNCNYEKQIEKLNQIMISGNEFLRSKLKSDITRIEKDREIIEFFFYIIGMDESFDPYILNDLEQRNQIKEVYQFIHDLKFHESPLVSTSCVSVVSDMIMILEKSLFNIGMKVPECLKSYLLHHRLPYLTHSAYFWESKAIHAQQQGIDNEETQPTIYKDWQLYARNRRCDVYSPYWKSTD